MADASAYISAAAEHKRKKNALDRARANYVRLQITLILFTSSSVYVALQPAPIASTIC